MIARQDRALPGGEHTHRAPWRRVRARLLTPAFVDFAIATFAILLIASPLLFTRDGFAPDFTNDIWLSNYQHHAIAAHLYPTLFMQTEQGVFFPLFAFYGGTLFALTGALGVPLGGSTLLAFEVVTLAAMAAAYGGLFWIARQLGVRGAMAHAPAIVFVTSAYYVTDLYGRGAWPEFMAVSALPLVLAASLSLLRGRLRVAPAVCLVAASVVFSGSHNITLLWGSTVAVLALAVFWLLSGRSRRLPWRRIAAVAGLLALGFSLNAWFLIPDAIYAHKTLVGSDIIPWSATGGFNTAGVIFDPLRTVPSSSGTPALYVQAPVLALIWGLLALPLCWRDRRLRAGVLTALIALAGLLVLIMSASAYALLPDTFKQVQFAYRLQTYVTLACAGLVLLGTLALTRRERSERATSTDRGLRIGLGLVLAFSVALSVWQLWVPTTHIYEGYFSSYTNRAEALSGPPTTLPESWNAGNTYSDLSLPIVPTAATVTFDPATLGDDRISGSGQFPPGVQPFATNIAGGPYFVHVGGGVRVVGRTAQGYLALQRTAKGSGPVPFELSARSSAPVVLGRIVTGASAALLLLALAFATMVAAMRRWRRRSAGHA